MQYLAAHYWQSAESGNVSMLLQQAYHNRRKITVVLACICTNRAVVKALSEWFYESALPMCGKRGERGTRRLCRCLKHILKKEGNGPGVQMAGVLCVGREIMFFQRGSMQIKVLNMRYQRAHTSSLQLEKGKEESVMFREGMIQPNVGILLTTETFENCVPREMWEKCLKINALRNQRSMRKRLCELGNVGEENKGCDMAAILLLSR